MNTKKTQSGVNWQNWTEISKDVVNELISDWSVFQKRTETLFFDLEGYLLFHIRPGMFVQNLFDFTNEIIVLKSAVCIYLDALE